MMYHDRFACMDKRCYGYTRDEIGKAMPPTGNDFLSHREVGAVVKYLLPKQSGSARLPMDYVDFQARTRQCDPMKKRDTRQDLWFGDLCWLRSVRRAK